LEFTEFPHGPLLAFFTGGITERTWENRGREMKTRTAGRVQWIGIAALAFLACGAAMASDVEWQIPLIRDTEGSGLTMELSREGARRTATPFLTLFNPTVQRIENRIAKTIAPWAAKEIPSGTSREDSGRPETIQSSLPPVPGEITLRSVQGFLKKIRASLKKKPAPAVVVAGPELRLGRTDPSLP